jgi:hypothetical protein
MNSITKAEFELALEGAVSRRVAHYTNFYALHVRWEDNNTSADRQLLGTSPATRFPFS